MSGAAPDGPKIPAPGQSPGAAAGAQSKWTSKWLKSSLVLQRQIGREPSEAAFGVAAAGLGLALPTPARPVQPVLALLVGEEQEG